MSFSRIGFLLSTVVILLWVLNSMLFVVDQRQFGVLYSFGKAQIARVIAEPGLYFKLPAPLQSVDFLDKRLLTLDSRGTDIIQTIEKQNIVIDWFVRWRITDPASYIRNVGTSAELRETRLTQVIRNSFQEEINRRTVDDLLSPKREALMAAVARSVNEDVSRKQQSWGIHIVDVRLTRMDYPRSIVESVYRRMEAERKRVANEKRSKGVADADLIRAEAERERSVVIAEGYRQAATLKGEGEAKAAAIYGQSFGKDTRFAAFLQQLEAYKVTLNKKLDILVLDPKENDFYKSLLGSQ